MEITEVRVKLVPGGNDKLRAFCSVTIDDQFVVRDLKIIEGSKGAFVAMPSRKLTARCPRCGGKNHSRARFCNDCGKSLPDHGLVVGGGASGGGASSRGASGGGVAGGRAERDDMLGGGDSRAAVGRSRYHADVAHPINSACREMIQDRVLAVYYQEIERSRQPGYQPMDLDVFEADSLAERSELFEESAAGRPFTSPPERAARAPAGGLAAPSWQRLRELEDEPEDNFGAGLLS